MPHRGGTLDGALDWMGVAHLLGEEGAEPSLVDVGQRKPLLAPEQILLYGFRRDQSTRAERAAIERRQLDVVEYEEVAAAPAASALQALERLSPRCERLLVHFDGDYPCARAAEAPPTRVRRFTIACVAGICHDLGGTLSEGLWSSRIAKRGR